MASSAITTAPFLAKVQNLTDNDGHSVVQFLPPGTVLPFAGTTAPTGFLLCNGATVSRSTYSKLFAAIGSAHGAGDGSTTFHLPDYRGRFLRGADGGVARDPDRAARTAANSGGATGDAVGSVQGNATAKNGLSGSSGGQSADHTHYDVGHAHNLVVPDGGAGVNHGNQYTVGGPTTRVSTVAAANLQGASGNHTHGISISGDSETRPVNANVNYIIKI